MLARTAGWRAREREGERFDERLAFQSLGVGIYLEVLTIQIILSFRHGGLVRITTKDIVTQQRWQEEEEEEIKQREREREEAEASVSVLLYSENSYRRLARHGGSCLLGGQHHLDELFVVDLAITIDIGFADHLIDLFVGKLLAKVRHDVAKFGSRDETIAVLVEDLEGIADLVVVLGGAHLLGHHAQELTEVDGAIVVLVDLANHVAQLGLGWVLTKRTHDGAELLGGDLAIAVLVEQREGLLELGDLFFRESISHGWRWEVGAGGRAKAGKAHESERARYVRCEQNKASERNDGETSTTGH
jgi:hypothetical protein